MATNVDSLILDLLQWLGEGARPYAEALEVWGTSCPGLTVWEQAHGRGLVERRVGRDGSAVLVATARGREHLRGGRAQE